MTLITLRELNQDFLAESTSPKRKTGNESKKASVPEFDNSGVEVAKEAQITGESRAKVSCQRSERAVDGNKRLTFALISDIIFYLAVILILLYVFISGVDSGVPKTFFGY
ncbi:MAG: hypothetical protein FWE76_08615, partial [Symbiobacteriaceae bacterium]|nr:hypothetical protein [Symbiobacteriaceae bacterium]